MREFLLTGEWRSSERGFSVHFPFDGSIVEEMALPGEADFETAVRSADEFFRGAEPPPVYERVAVLRRASKLLKGRADEFAETITLEAGKILRDARLEASRAAGTLHLCAEELLRLGGEVLEMETAPVAEKRYAFTRWFPAGVVLAITPFNYPLNLVCHKVGPAIAAGCPVVLKPSRKTPLSALMLAEVLLEAGLDGNFLSVLPAESEVAEKFVSDERIAILTFTGSSAVGWHLRSLTRKQRVLLELGGNAGCIVAADADVEFAVERCLYGAFGNAGQICISLQRLLVDSRIFDEFVKLFVDGVERLKVGDPRNPETDVGPMIDEGAAQRAKEWVEEALEGGAELLSPLKVDGTLFHPVVLTQTKPDMRVWSEEVFAPVVAIERFTDFDEAVRLVDDGRYGLQAGIFTNDLRRIEFAFRRIRVGGLMVNEVPTYRQDAMPYGGLKESGVGKEGPRYAIREMMEERLIMLNPKMGDR